MYITCPTRVIPRNARGAVSIYNSKHIGETWVTRELYRSTLWKPRFREFTRMRILKRPRSREREKAVPRGHMIVIYIGTHTARPWISPVHWPCRPWCLSWGIPPSHPYSPASPTPRRCALYSLIPKRRADLVLSNREVSSSSRWSRKRVSASSRFSWKNFSNIQAERRQRCAEKINMSICITFALVTAITW